MAFPPNDPHRSLTGRYFIGLMSGTSMDGVDGVLVRLAPNQPLQLLASTTINMPEALRVEFMALNISGNDELHRAALAANELVHLYAQACHRLLQDCGLMPADICAIGAHGQTVRHRPDQGYTLQLNAPALLAELTEIDVVADFRSRDVAAGGQGAPLVPPFHAAMFGQHQCRAILNLGGIANVTLLTPGHTPRGFDTGPANVLLDGWCQRHIGRAYDNEGHWSMSGVVRSDLLAYLIASEPWFALAPPKSTGRDRFDLAWLDARLASFPAARALPADVQATLVMLTATTIAQAIRAEHQAITEVLVCGGGARNPALMQALAQDLHCPVRATDSQGVPAQWVEAMAFAWLAQAYIDRQPAGLPSVTGARQARVLGAIYLA